MKNITIDSLKEALGADVVVITPSEEKAGFTITIGFHTEISHNELKDQSDVFSRVKESIANTLLFKKLSTEISILSEELTKKNIELVELERYKTFYDLYKGLK